jgi:two-component system, NarL family, sensor kinase
MGNNNADIVIIIISTTVVLFILLTFIIVFIFMYKSRQARNERDIKGIEEKYNQDILKTQLEIQEQTLKNISEEIHDNMGQVLSLVVLNLSSVEFGDADAASAKIERSTNLVKKVITDLRNLSRTFDTEHMTQVGLPAIIRVELEMLAKTGLFHTSFMQEGPEQRLDTAREIIAYRIVQESLNNVMKHAKATEVRIAVEFSEKLMAIEITDNGIGFDATMGGPANAMGNGAGLKNMKNRAKLIGGELSIKSVPSCGTGILLIVPIM